MTVDPSSRDAILVTGATGRIGRLVVDALLRTGASVRALTRRPADANLPSGVEVIAGDFTVPQSLDSALIGATAVFLVWTAAPSAAAAVVDRLAEQSATRPLRIVYLSAPFRTPHPLFQQPNPMRDVHAEVERLLEAARLAVTIIRPGMFASNALHWWAPQIRHGDVVRWPYPGVETAPVDERDLAAVAARILLDAAHVGRDYVLTGPESLSQAAQVQTIADVIGRSIRYEAVSPDDFRREVEATWPPGVANMLLNAWGAAVGHPAFVTSAIQDILMSPARTFREWVADNAAAFSAPTVSTSSSR